MERAVEFIKSDQSYHSIYPLMDFGITEYVFFYDGKVNLDGEYTRQDLLDIAEILKRLEEGKNE